MIAEVARLLKENKKSLPFGLYITNAVQEEVGLRGAQMIVERIQPDVAIVTDVCHDTQTPMINKIEQGPHGPPTAAICHSHGKFDTGTMLQKQIQTCQIPTFQGTKDWFASLVLSIGLRTPSEQQ